MNAELSLDRRKGPLEIDSCHRHFASFADTTYCPLFFLSISNPFVNLWIVSDRPRPRKLRGILHPDIAIVSVHAQLSPRRLSWPICAAPAGRRSSRVSLNASSTQNGGQEALPNRRSSGRALGRLSFEAAFQLPPTGGVVAYLYRANNSSSSRWTWRSTNCKASRGISSTLMTAAWKAWFNSVM